MTYAFTDKSAPAASTRSPLILFVEDDLELGPLLMRILTEQGYTVQWVPRAEDALDMIPLLRPDLVLCDRMLPGMDGIEFCKEVRQRGFTQQILMLTALNADNNMVEGLDAGADDYLGKPFSYPVLIAKVKAMLRRVSISGPQTVLQLADLRLNTTNRTVMRGETLIKLTAREFHLLYYLLRHKGQIKTRSQILEAVWGLDFDPGTNVVDVYLNYLRTKIDKPFEHKLLHTYIGMGYALREKA